MRSGPLRRALLQEGAHAFLRVVGPGVRVMTVRISSLGAVLVEVETWR
jgi:hypothetical protein